MPQHIYPVILTNKNWQKKKGLLAKSVGETGVGEAMDKLKKAYEKVNWVIFDPGKALPQDKSTHTEEGLGMVILNAKAELKTTIGVGVKTHLEALEKKVSATKKAFDKMKTIPKSASDLCDEILNAIGAMEDEISETTLLKELQENVKLKLHDFENTAKVNSQLTQKLKSYIVQVNNGLTTVKTVGEFAAPFWKEHVRGVGTSLPRFAEELGLEKELESWRIFTSENFKPQADNEVAGKLKEIKKVLKTIAGKLN